MRYLITPDVRTINWNVDANGTWFTASNWTPQNVPGGYDRDATIANVLTSGRVITINDHVTLRNLFLNYTGGAITILASAGKKIYFNSKTTCAITFTAGNSNTLSISADCVFMQSITLTKDTGILSMSGIFSGTISDFIKAGAGTLTLSGLNTFIATITITAGTLGCGADTALGDSSNAIVFNGGTLNFTSGITSARNMSVVATSSKLSSSGNCVFSGTISGSIALNCTANGSSTLEYSGSITLSGTLSFTSGTHKISGTHSGTGNIAPSINNPVFIITGSITSSTGTITGLSIKGNGSVAKATTLPSTGTIEASDGVSTPGTFTFTNTLILGASGFVTVRTSGSTVSKIAVTGNVTIRGTANFPDASLNTGTYDIITYTGTGTVTALTLGTNSTGRTITFFHDTVNKKYQIIVV
jgi:autotransporter-associated beta strand protein